MIWNQTLTSGSYTISKNGVKDFHLTCCEDSIGNFCSIKAAKAAVLEHQATGKPPTKPQLELFELETECE